MSGQKIKQNDEIIAGGPLLERVAIAKLSEEQMFELRSNCQEGASLVKLRKKSILGRERNKCQGRRAEMS